MAAMCLKQPHKVQSVKGRSQPPADFEGNWACLMDLSVQLGSPPQPPSTPPSDSVSRWPQGPSHRRSRDPCDASSGCARLRTLPKVEVPDIVPLAQSLRRTRQHRPPASSTVARSAYCSATTEFCSAPCSAAMAPWHTAFVGSWQCSCGGVRPGRSAE